MSPRRCRFTLTTLVSMCASVGALAFASTPAMAKTGHVFSSSFTGSGANALSEPSGVALNNETGDVYVVDKGHNRVEEFNATGTAVLAEFNGSVGPPQPFSSPEAIAVDNSGSGVDPSKEDVYVADTGNRVIDKFSSIGVYEGQLTGTCASPGTCPGSIIPFGELNGVAVDPEGNVWVYAVSPESGLGVIDEFSDAGSFVKTFGTSSGVEPGLAVDSSDNLYVTVGGESVGKFSSTGEKLEVFSRGGTSALAIDSATNNLFVDKASSIQEYGPFGEPFSEPLTTFPSEGLSGSDGIAVNADTGTVYATQREAGSVEIFDAVPFPVVGAEPVSNRAVSSVTLNGTVDPEGVEVTSCEFEYGTEAGVYPQKEPCSHALPLTGGAPVPVSANLAGLTPDTTYHYRLLATNAGNLTEVTPDQEFTTRGAGISDESVENVEPTAATLKARINPNESETTYHFEYDTSPYNTSASHGTSLPVPDATIASGTSPVPVSVPLKGLQPGTSYHYRVVAVSELAPGDFETFDGPDKVFTTPTPPGEAHGEGCPNEQLRTEQPYGSTLPDCRAYEQVSPVDKNDNDIAGPAPGVGTTLVRASVSGEAITYDSYGSFDDPVGARLNSRYVSRRGAGGWSTQNITPLYSALGTELSAPYDTLVFTPDLSKGVVRNQDPPLTSDATRGCANLYLADIANSSYQLVTPRCFRPGEFGAESEPEVQGASTDLSHIVFTEYTEGGPLYEWVNGSLSLVSVDPGGTPMTAEIGSGDYTEAIVGQNRWRAVSNDGSRVFFTGNPNTEIEAERRQLYVRENAEQPENCTVSTGACTVEVSASQRLTADPHGPQPAEYLGASVDGSKVFFDSRAELTEDANTGEEDNAANLYEYDLEKPVGERLTDLTVDTNVGDLKGAAVLGLVTAGEDGSYVYFVAEGVLAGRAVSGQPNLYLSHNGGTPSFIATLAPREGTFVPRDSRDWSEAGGPANNTVRITPDGTHLAFLSQKSLTGYDNQPAEPAASCEPYPGGGSLPCSEVFSYDAVSGSLSCVSCNPSGAPPAGSSNLSDASGSNPRETFYYTPRNFSTDGSRLFFQSRDALVPHASNGLQNVYEYEDGHVYLISDGAGSYESQFMDASPSGNDVFIVTADQLVASDTDFRVDVYDAKVGGGFPVTVAAPACTTAEACRTASPPTPAVFGAPPSATFAGPGNFPPPPPPAVAKPKPKSLTRAQKLKKALKACKKLKKKTKRLACERQANKKYGPVKKKAKRSSTHSKKGRK